MSQALASAPVVRVNPPPKRRRVLPGFGLSLGFTLSYLSLIVLIPIAALVAKSATLGGHLFWETITAPATVSAYRVSFGASAIAASINGVFGLIVAWTLVRYRFPLRRFFDALIDLPFALPTAVAGIALSDLYSPHGWIGRWGLDYSYTFGGIVIALIFVGLPFVVRSVQPVLQEMDKDVEEAAESLGATRAYTFRRVIIPALLPAWLSGFALAFARALGEYGSVVFISRNQPNQSEIVPTVIASKVAENSPQATAQATAVAVVLLVSSLVILLAINAVQWWSRRHET
jgi:sulfate transport system permease protein